MNRPEVFQVDHPLVRQAYRGDNHKIVFDDTRPKEICALYFSSNNIYFPNDESVFRKRIVEADAYEWYRTRVRAAHKHVFLRDVFKQWYLTGLNDKVSTPEALLEFLRAQTEGYRVVALGSSAGGYAAVLYGSLLGAERILSFNGQMELDSLLASSVPEINPSCSISRTRLCASTTTCAGSSGIRLPSTTSTRCIPSGIATRPPTWPTWD